MNFRIKKQGGVYTPASVVQTMLNLLDYGGPHILAKHVMENSCGNGSFLTEIVGRYCAAFHNCYGQDTTGLKQHLESYIHGIEIDSCAWTECIQKLDEIVASYGIFGVKWNIKHANALFVKEYDGKMDFVVGNPPYVRVHHMDEASSVKKFQFSRQGMTDLYLAFFEISLKQLKPDGKLCLITPSSFLTSKSGSVLRNYIITERTLKTVIDLGREKVFGDVMAYTLITLFEKKSRFSSIQYKAYGDKAFSPMRAEAVFFKDKILFEKPLALDLVQKIERFYNSIPERKIVVKNGFATLADSIFLGAFPYRENILIQALKASTGEWKTCLFPYNKNGDPLSEEILRRRFPMSYEYLRCHKSALLARSLDAKSPWFAFGRSQAIKDVNKYKIAVNVLIKDFTSIKLQEIPPGCGVYSGLYILSPYSLAQVRKAVFDEDFLSYVHALRKYKSGGYVTFSSKDLEKYLVFKLQQGQ